MHACTCTAGTGARRRKTHWRQARSPRSRAVLRCRGPANLLRPMTAAQWRTTRTAHRAGVCPCMTMTRQVRLYHHHMVLLLYHLHPSFHELWMALQHFRLWDKVVCCYQASAGFVRRALRQHRINSQPPRMKMQERERRRRPKKRERSEKQTKPGRRRKPKKQSQSGKRQRQGVPTRLRMPPMPHTLLILLHRHRLSQLPSSHESPLIQRSSTHRSPGQAKYRRKRPSPCRAYQ